MSHSDYSADRPRDRQRVVMEMSDPAVAEVVRQLHRRLHRLEQQQLPPSSSVGPLPHRHHRTHRHPSPPLPSPHPPSPPSRCRPRTNRSPPPPSTSHMSGPTTPRPTSSPNLLSSLPFQTPLSSQLTPLSQLTSSYMHYRESPPSPRSGRSTTSGESSSGARGSPVEELLSPRQLSRFSPYPNPTPPPLFTSLRSPGHPIKGKAADKHKQPSMESPLMRQITVVANTRPVCLPVQRRGS